MAIGEHCQLTRYPLKLNLSQYQMALRTLPLVRSIRWGKRSLRNKILVGWLSQSLGIMVIMKIVRTCRRPVIFNIGQSRSTKRLRWLF